MKTAGDWAAGGDGCGLAWLNGVNLGRCSLAGVGDANRDLIGDTGGAGGGDGGGGGGGGGGCGGL